MYLVRGRSDLTFEEQNALKDTILLATNNGKDLTFKQIRDFMAEEVSNIVHQYPERSEALSKYIDPIGLSTEIRTSACKLCA